VNDKLASLVVGLPVMDIPVLFQAMVQGCRNYGDSTLTCPR
jgi:hypothetical protein